MSRRKPEKISDEEAGNRWREFEAAQLLESFGYVECGDGSYVPGPKFREDLLTRLHSICTSLKILALVGNDEFKAIATAIEHYFGNAATAAADAQDEIAAARHSRRPK